jgi:putative ABC transport system permease protein
MIRRGVQRAFNLAIRRRDRWQADVEDEIELHLTLRAEQFMARGSSPSDAYAEAVRRFGPMSESRARMFDAARYREQRIQRIEYLAQLRQDVSFAFRTLHRQKGWTAITVFTLALGIGATTAVFSVVSSLVLHTISYPNADRVVIVDQQPTQGNNTGLKVSITPSTRIVNGWRSRARSFEALEPYRSQGLLLRTDDDPVPVNATQILPSFLTFTGTRPITGRIFSAQEMENKTPVALLAEGIWRERYGSDAAIIGKTITLGDTAFTIIGVLPADLRLPRLGRDRVDVWVPLDLRNMNLGMNVLGRLRPGVTFPVATRELDAITVEVEAASNSTPNFVARIKRPSEMIDFRESLLMLAGAVALVLLVACANVAHLMIARASSRERELAVRSALGAGQSRLFRQLLTESLIISLAGAAGGIILGWFGLKAIVALRPPQMAELVAVHLDATTLGVTIVVGILSGVVFGVVAAFQSAKRSPQETLKAGALSTSQGRGQGRLRSVLVVSEMALTATLIVGATLLVRTVMNLQRANLGFEPKHLYWVSLSLPEKQFTTPASRVAFYTETMARLRVVPHVRELALTTVPVGSRSFSVGNFEIQGEPPTTSGSGTSFIDVNQIDEHYLKTMRIPLVEGTFFTDTSEAANQVIINAAFARAHWGPGGALGKRVRVAFKGDGQAPWSTIVGVAGDAQTTGADISSTAPYLYSSLSTPERQTTIMIRTDAAVDLATTLRQLVKSINPRVPTPTVQSVEGYVARTIAKPRFTMTLLTTFTFLGLMLAAVGLYGVMAYSVAQRTREIGIRMALGATQQTIANSVVRRGVSLALFGAVIGLGGAFYGTRLISRLLYGVAPLDFVSFATGAVVLILTAVLACVVPTRRALAVDPIRAIRAD